MTKRKRSKRLNPSPKIPKEVLLESGHIEDIEKLKRYGARYCEFHWHYYFSLVLQRAKILSELKKSLLGAAVKDFRFSKWQRTIAYKYSDIPLSVAGSLKDIGGRFNIGDIDPSFAPFSALYLSAHKDTALQEYLCQGVQDKGQAFDFALASPKSLTNISLNGRLTSVIDLRFPGKLQSFVDLIKGFTVPEFLIEAAKEINQPIILVRDIPSLVNALEDINWRLWPMQFDAPAPVQIFGQLVYGAGIEGIVYVSKFTGKECLVVFPDNFEESSETFIELQDDPPGMVKIRRLDGSSWKLHKKDLKGR